MSAHMLIECSGGNFHVSLSILNFQGLLAKSCYDMQVSLHVWIMFDDFSTLLQSSYTFFISLASTFCHSKPPVSDSSD
jgi:hypothetical protein